MRVPRKLSPSLFSVPLSSPPSLRPPPLSSSLHLCAAAGCAICAPRLRRQPGTPLPLQGPCPSETTGMSSEKSGKKQQNLPFPPSPDSSPPTILGPNPLPPLPLGGVFCFIPLLSSSQPPSPFSFYIPPFSSFPPSNLSLVPLPTWKGDRLKG